MFSSDVWGMSARRWSAYALGRFTSSMTKIAGAGPLEVNATP